MPVMTVINVCLLLCVVWLNYIDSTEAGADAGPWLAGVTVDVSGCSSETGSCDERFHYPRDEWPHPGFTDWFSFPYANVPGSEITGMLHYPTPHNACSPVDPPPGFIFSGSGLSSSGSAAGSVELEFGNDTGSAFGFGENIMWFAIVDDFSVCAATDKINNLRVAGYSLMISYPLEDLSSRDDISNTDFPVVLVSQSFANSVISATLTSQISASVSASESVQLLVAIALVAAIFVAVMIPVCIGVCICCRRCRTHRKRKNHDLSCLPGGGAEEMEMGTIMGDSESLSCDVPCEWEPQSRTTELFLVPKGSGEWNRVREKFEATMPKELMVQVSRIQNKWLWEKYQSERKRMHSKNKGNVNELELFHGTSTNDPKLVFKGEDGFDMRFSAQGLWGRANYFAMNASYSDGYAHKTPDGNKELLIAKVLAGDSYECAPNSSLRMPPVKLESGSIRRRYDSVTGTTGSSRVYMTYTNERAYPAYLIKYKTSA